MDAKADKNLHRLERKAIQEAEKRKKPGECMKVIKIDTQFRFDYLIIFLICILVCSSSHRSKSPK